MRHFYAEWSKKMQRPAFNPLGDNKLNAVKEVA